jgi:hypothetical protein
MELDITLEIVGVFIAFIVFLFLLSRVFKVLVKAFAIGGAGFSFPWVMQLIGLDLGIPVEFFTQLQFALLAVGLYLVYEFFTLVSAIGKLLFVPVKLLTGSGTGKSEIKKLRDEIDKLKKN